MTIQQAKNADFILDGILSYQGIDNGKITKEKLSANFLSFKADKPYWNYVQLLSTDGYVNINQRVGSGNDYIVVTAKGKAFIQFKGGYTKMIKGQIDVIKKEKTKYRFEIAKDIVLILLAVGTLIISYITS